MSNVSINNKNTEENLRKLSIALLLFSVPLQSFTLIFGVSVYEIVSLLVFIISIFLVFNYQEVTFWRKHLTTLLLFLLFTIFYSLSKIAHEEILNIIQFLFWSFSFLYALIIYRPLALNAFLWPVLWGVVIMVTVAVGHQFDIIPLFDFERIATFRESNYKGFTGLISSRGAYGIWLITGLMSTFLLFFLANSKAKKILTIAIAFLIIYGVVITFSRSTWVAAIIFILVFSFFKIFTRNVVLSGERFPLFAIAITMSFAIFIVLIFSGLIGNLIEAVVNIRKSSVDIRLTTYLEGLSIIKDLNLLGADASKLQRVIHNAYIAILVELGYPALVLFILLNLSIAYWLVKCILRLSSMRRTIAIIAFSGFLAVQVELNLFRGYESITYWAFLSQIVILLRYLRTPIATGKKYNLVNP
ncbi:hypothetical protein [Thiohalophilus sp.]|uniref:O-antigen ligase family protein n=1 Tax=Thiohalophilus sp. TaxID=3028392 RepID=UPI002ACDDF78|nr:hypothetical protein [Thiohalophilus sp.]MDZ7662812.1 hypothetical protein [Thiohalophilus sp.]